MAAGGHADRTVLPERLVGDRGGGPDADLRRGPLALARLGGRVEVEEQPRIGGLLEIELLDLDLAQARGRRPVDPVHRVAGGIRPHGRHQRRRLQGAFRRGVRALDARRWQAPQRQGVDARVDHQGHPLPHPGRCLEEPERVTGPDHQRLDPEVAAPDERGAHEPRALLAAAERERATGQPAGQRRGVVDLEPRLRDAPRVAQRVGDPELVADVAAQLRDRVPRLEVGQPEPGQDVAPTAHQQGEVDQEEQERIAGRERRHHEDDGEDQQLEAPEQGGRSSEGSRSTVVRVSRRWRRGGPRAGRRSGERLRSASRRAARG